MCGWYISTWLISVLFEWIVRIRFCMLFFLNANMIGYCCCRLDVISRSLTDSKMTSKRVKNFYCCASERISPLTDKPFSTGNGVRQISITTWHSNLAVATPSTERMANTVVPKSACSTSHRQAARCDSIQFHSILPSFELSFLNEILHSTVENLNWASGENRKMHSFISTHQLCRR